MLSLPLTCPSRPCPDPPFLTASHGKHPRRRPLQNPCYRQRQSPATPYSHNLPSHRTQMTRNKASVWNRQSRLPCFRLNGISCKVGLRVTATCAGLIHARLDQDQHLDNLSHSINRQHHISLQINEELDVHHSLLTELDAEIDTTQSQLGRARQKLDHVARGVKNNGSLPRFHCG